MTPTLPDLVRPTLWRLHLRTHTWSAPALHREEGVYLDDALKAAQSRGISLERVLVAEFLRLDTDSWQSVPQPSLKEAIVLVTRI